MNRAAMVCVLAACGSNAVAIDAANGDAPRGIDAPQAIDAANDAANDAPLGILTVSPMTMNFGAVAVSQHSAPQPFTISNTGATIISSVTISITNTQFIQTATTCNHPLATGGTCEVVLEFMPSVAGGQSGSLNITGSNSASTVAVLSGTTTSDTFLLSVSPVAYSFGLVQLGDSSVAQRFALTNVGVSATTALAVTWNGEPTEFPIVADTCSGAVVPPSGTCIVDVVFSPTVASVHTGQLSFDSNGRSVVAKIDGSGAAARLSIEDPTYDFGTTGPGVPSAPYQFRIWNLGTATATSLNLALGSPDFVVTSTTCGATLAVDASCTQDIVFSPSSTGFKMTTLLSTATYAASAVATLTGHGVTEPAGFLTANPSPYDFNAIAVGQAASFTFTITNQGVLKTSALTLMLGGTSRAAYAVAMDTCTGAQLATGMSCTFAVVFRPTLIGTQYASVTAVATQGGTVTANIIGTGN